MKALIDVWKSNILFAKPIQELRMEKRYVPTRPQQDKRVENTNGYQQVFNTLRTSRTARRSFTDFLTIMYPFRLWDWNCFRFDGDLYVASGCFLLRNWVVVSIHHSRFPFPILYQIREMDAQETQKHIKQPHLKQHTRIATRQL